MKKVIEYTDDEGRKVAFAPFPELIISLIENGDKSYVAFYKLNKLFSTSEFTTQKDASSLYGSLKAVIHFANQTSQ